MRNKIFLFKSTTLLITFLFSFSMVVSVAPISRWALRPTSSAAPSSSNSLESIQKQLGNTGKTSLAGRIWNSMKIRKDLRRLKSLNPHLHESAEESLIKAAPLSIPFLIKSLEEEDIRDYCIEILVKIGFPVFEDLRKNLLFRGKKIGSGAKEALCRIEDARVTDEILKYLKQIKDQLPPGRIETSRIKYISILGKRRALGAVDTLKELIEDEDEHKDVWSAAALALGEIKDRRVKDALVKILERKEWLAEDKYPMRALEQKQGPIREAAAWALGELGDPATADVLKSRLDDENEQVCKSAALALYKNDYKPENMTDTVLYNIALNNLDEIVKIGAPAVPALREVLINKPPHIWRPAMNILSDIDDPSATDALAEALNHTDLCKFAAEALSKKEDVRALTSLIQGLGLQRDWDRRPIAFILYIKKHPLLEQLMEALACGPAGAFCYPQSPEERFFFEPLTDEQIELICKCLKENRGFQVEYTPGGSHLEENLSTYGAVIGYITVVGPPAKIKKIIPGEIAQPELIKPERKEPKEAKAGVPTEVIQKLAPQYKPDVQFWNMEVGYIDPVYKFYLKYEYSKKSYRLNIHTIVNTLNKRSWMWNHIRSSKRARDKAIRKIKFVQPKIPGIISTLAYHKILPWTPDLVSIYLMGSYPWVKSANDIDLVIIVDGHHDFTRIPLSKIIDGIDYLKQKKSLAGLNISVEIVGLETLRKAARGVDFDMAKIIRRKLITYSGAIPLMGIDIFSRTKPPLESYKVMQDDLLKDAELAQWDDIKGGIKKIEAKKRWRYEEAYILKEWTEMQERKRSEMRKNPNEIKNQQRNLCTEPMNYQEKVYAGISASA